jgi:antitoxin MazE
MATVSWTFSSWRDYIVITMKAKIVRIGNSRGIRIPKPLLEEAGLVGEVEIVVEDNALVIRPVAAAREGWAEAAREAAERGDDGLLDEQVSTRFDIEEWEWDGDPE